MGSPVELLRRVPLFEELDDAELERLAACCRPRIYTRGSPVVNYRSRGCGFFVIEEGSASVRVRDEERARLGRGDYFGEMALIDGGRRSATVVAETDLHCYGIHRDDFRPFVKEHPEVAWALLEALTARLRAAEAEPTRRSRTRRPSAGGALRRRLRG